jgi:hypothetical protein
MSSPFGLAVSGGGMVAIGLIFDRDRLRQSCRSG